MIIVTQAQLRNKDTEAIILLRNEIKASLHHNSNVNIERDFKV